MENRLTLSNFGDHTSARKSQYAFPGKRRLVEECEAICIWAIQRAFGKKSLIAYIREARPLQLPVPGGCYDVWFVDEPHRLPGKIERWSSLEDSTARLWFICPGCRKKRAKLFYYVFPGTSVLSDLLCGECHRLTHLSTNSGGRQWYMQIARPLKALLKERDKLLPRRDFPRVQARLMGIEAEIEALKKQVRPKTQRRRLGWWKSQRRAYRNIGLLE